MRQNHLKPFSVSVGEAQAWQDDPSKPYPEEWDAGRYMVVIGLSQDQVYFMDPSVLGGFGYIPAMEFLGRWHDISAKGEKLHHTALYFQGEPAPLAAWQYVE